MSSQQRPPIAPTVGPTKVKKLGFLEAVGQGLKIGIPTAKQAAKVAYEQGRKKQASRQNELSDVSSGPSQHNTFTGDQLVSLQNEPRRATQYDLPLAPSGRLHLDFESEHEAKSPARTGSLPAHVSPPNEGPASLEEDVLNQNRTLSSPVHITPFENSSAITHPRNESPGKPPVPPRKQLPYEPLSPRTEGTFLEDGDSLQEHKEPPSIENDRLLRIQNLVMAAGYDFPGLRVLQGESVEDAVNRFLEEYRRLSNAHNQTAQRLTEAHELLNRHQGQAATLRALETNLRETEHALRACRTELEDKRKEAANKQRDMLKAQTMLGEHHAKHGREKNEMQIRIQQLQREHTDQLRDQQNRFQVEKEGLKSWYADQIRQARTEEGQRLQHEIGKLKDGWNDEHCQWTVHVEAVKEGYERRIRDAQPEFDRQRRETEEVHHQQMTAEREKYDATVAEYESRLFQLAAKAEEENQELRDQLQAEQDKLQEERKQHAIDLKKQEARLTQKHTYETLQLRTVNEELKQGLFQRTIFRGLRDRDLTSKFRVIMGQVQDFANLEWDSHRMQDWPLREHQLLNIHRENTRKLKKQIIQNTLWVLLYNHIFASPFRVLGVEGRDLDSDWIQIYAPNTSSLEWPKMPEEVEKRRYEVGKSFLAVMDPSARASGDNLRYKTGYESSISMTIGALYRALGRVATMEDRHGGALDGLVRLCARTWLEFCSQPYRLLVSLPNGSGDLLSAPRTNERALTLVINPELKRYGNSQGENLDRGEVVPDCQASVQSYPSR